MLRVKIIQGCGWYTQLVGQEFDVEEGYNHSGILIYFVDGDRNKPLYKSNCIIIKKDL
jgi:hypothetical protein